MALANTEIVYEGWLVKSPPTKRIWRAKWRRRWFVLKHSGELPGQYFLEYYTDRTYRKLKGKIDLDQCDQVDSGLTIESRKQRYAHMFDIRTPKRVYFLAADSESDMNNWVGCICHVCGLKVFYHEDHDEATGGSTLTLTRPPPLSGSSTASGAAGRGAAATTMEDTPPVSPTSPTGSSGPYFPLSECLSGYSSPFFHEVMASINQPSSAPVTPAPTRGLSNASLNIGTQSLRGKPRREDWDLFYDQPRQLGTSAGGSGHAGGTGHAGNSDLGADPAGGVALEVRGFEEKFARSFKKLLPTSQSSAQSPGPQSATVGGGGERFVAPPRPPKPAHLSSDHPSHNYLNLDQVNVPKTPSRSSSPRSPPSVSPPLPTPTNPDAWYDFPRSHQSTTVADAGDAKEAPASAGAGASTKEGKRRHCYTNAAPGEMAPTAEIFTFNNNTLPPPPPPSTSSSASLVPPPSAQTVYSNLQSPLPVSSPSPFTPGPFTPTPFTPGPFTPTPFTPPSVNRTLKPRSAAGTAVDVVTPPPSVNRQLKPHRPPGAGPPAESHCSSSDDADEPSSRGSSRPNSAHEDDQVYRLVQGSNQFLVGGGGGGGGGNRRSDEIQYLDLDLEDSSLQSPKSPDRGPIHHLQASSTVYKTVDFLKTEAFNRTRLTVEADRKPQLDKNGPRSTQH